MSEAELQRPWMVDRIDEAGTTVDIAADPAECDAIAARLELPGLATLRCRWQLRRAAFGTVEAEGSLSAVLTQTCVVSLDPFESTLVEEFAVRFVPSGRESDSADDPDEPDELVYQGAIVDLGAAMVEQLALALDPYPRKPGVQAPAAAPDGPDKGLAALAKWRPRE